MGIVYNPNLTEGLDNLFILNGKSLGDTILSIDYDNQELVLFGGFTRKGPLIRFWGWVGIVSGAVALIAIIGYIINNVRQSKIKNRLEEYENIQN
jgi:hypothetical protein